MIYSKLYPWQQNIINKYKYKDSLGLFLDMGLGKTPLSLALAEANSCTKVLIVTLNSKVLEKRDIKGSWLYWQTEMQLPYLINIKKHPDVKLDNDFYITNYESLFCKGKDKDTKKSVTLKEDVLNFIKGCNADNVAIIIDESHKMKNLQSSQTKALYEIKKLLKLNKNKIFTYLLTGTPFTTGYIDLYTQLKFLGFEMTKGEFKERFCVLGNNPYLPAYAQPIIRYKNLDELYEIVHKFALTLKSEDVVDLPEKTFVEHEIKQSDEFMYYTREKLPGVKILQKLQNDSIMLEDTSKYNTNTKVNNPFYRDLDLPDNRWEAETAGAFFLRCRELSIGFLGNTDEYIWYNRDRLNALEKLLENNPDNYILFYNYTPELLEIHAICEKLGYNIDIYCGAIKSLQFYEKYSKQSIEERSVNTKGIILANFASGSAAINFQNYNKCILFSVPVYRDYAQGVKRIHRIGQDKTCIYHIFYSNNFLDKSMKDSLKECKDYDERLFERDLEKENL